MSKPNRKPTHINAGTPMPFTITRNLVTWDADENEVRLPAVRITIERACWDADSVEEVGFEGDWFCEISTDPRFAGLDLDDDAIALAEDCICHFVEHLASTLAAGDSVPVNGDDDRDWFPKANHNF